MLELLLDSNQNPTIYGVGIWQDAKKQARIQLRMAQPQLKFTGVQIAGAPLLKVIWAAQNS